MVEIILVGYFCLKSHTLLVMLIINERIPLDGVTVLLGNKGLLLAWIFINGKEIDYLGGAFNQKEIICLRNLLSHSTVSLR